MCRFSSWRRQRQRTQAPGVERAGQQRGDQRCHGHPRDAAAHLRVARALADDEAADADRGRHGRRAAARQQRERRDHAQPRLPVAVRRARQCPQEEADTEQLRQFGRRLVAQLQQAQRGDERQQRAVGNGARVVHRVGLAAEREGGGLGRFGAREMEGRVPDRGHRQGEQQREGQARRHVAVDQWRQQGDEERTQPVRQQRGVARHAAQRRRKPGGAALGDGRHLRIGHEVGIAPRVAVEQPRQHVGGRQQQQRDARQAPGAALGDEGRGGAAHGCWIMPEAQAQKRQPELPFLRVGRRAASPGCAPRRLTS